MPLYDYHCNNCDLNVELLSSVDDRNNPPSCPECETEGLVLVVRGCTNFSLKGRGWAEDGYSGNFIDQIHNMEREAGLRNNKGETRDIVPIEERSTKKSFTT